jgi:outer membrane immunogenic protein
MKKLLLALTAVTAFTGSAIAADPPARTYTKAPPPVVAPIYSWAGFYIGLNGGGGSSHKCWNIEQSGPRFFPDNPEGCHDATGGTVGGQVGYRWQMTNWVFGLEAQGNWANFKGSNLNSLAGTTFAAGQTDESKIQSFGLFTGQVGYAWNNVLWYVKGGAAVVSDKYRTYTPAIPLLDSASETRWGGTVGTGIEIGFAPHWSVAFEYDHLFMGGRNVTANSRSGAFSAVDSIRQDVDIGTVRVNYTFGGPVVAKY